MRCVGATLVGGLALFVLPADEAATSPPALDCSVVPGWTQEGPARVFEPDNLFDYMDGNAEGYLLYGFERMDGVTCRQGDERLVVDMSQMADHAMAFGIFTANRDTRRPSTDLGMGGQITPRKAVFVKDRYYVEITAQSERDHTPLLTAFAAALEKRIAGRAEPPEALAWFPPQGLVADSVRLVPESVLGVRALPRGYVGRYDVGEAFVVTSGSAAEAGAILAKLRARWTPQSAVPIADEAFAAHDAYLGDLIVFRKGTRVAGFAKLAAGAVRSAHAEPVQRCTVM